MTRQTKHIRKSKRGHLFVAGRKQEKMISRKYLQEWIDQGAPAKTGAYNKASRDAVNSVYTYRAFDWKESMKAGRFKGYWQGRGHHVYNMGGGTDTYVLLVMKKGIRVK